MTTTTSLTPDRLIGGRYRAEGELGRGGMARVYRALDVRSGEQVALKQLLGNAENATARAMFEREYHTLVQLAHPNIVRVFDYGVDADDPYYTMELLAGADARDIIQDGPLGVQQICSVLRDCAAALALIHSRRMVHRDVSPRNLWCTPERRGKLIDFGTLVAMGPQGRVAGTPPFVAPEAIYMQPLDARYDLYGLGALGYFMLTQQQAYPARTLGELPKAWQRSPAQPQELQPHVPRALSDLIMAMISLDARARPASAAEVYERLSAIAELPAEDRGLTARAFLTHPTLVGRASASVAIASALRDTLGGQGGRLCISAPSGLGRSRMLASAVLQAKLGGAAAVAVDANAVTSGPLHLAIHAAELLLEALPMVAAAAIDLGPVLGHASAELRRAFGSPELAEFALLQRAPRLAAAIVNLFQRAAAQRPLLLAIDDVHRSDAASLAVFGRLSLEAGGRRLLVLTTCDADALEQAPPALEQLVQQRGRVELAPLTAAEMHALLESVFGAVVGLDALSSWIHELAAGSPQACMQYAEYLVDQDIARFSHGRWELPAQPRGQALPPTLREMLARRVAALSGDAFALALGLALARDDSRASWQPATQVRVQDFPKLLESPDGARAAAALNELLRAGIVQQRDESYVLAQRAMVDALIEAAPDQARKASHRRLANIFTQPGYRATWVAIQQLLEADEPARARLAILEAANAAATGAADWNAMRVSLQVLCANQALAHWQRERGAPKEGVILRRMVLTAGSVYDWRVALQHAEPQLAQLRSDCGIAYLEETDAARPIGERVLECFQRAQKAHDAKPESERSVPPAEAIRELAGAAMALSRIYVNTHESAAARSLLPSIEALHALVPPLDVVVATCKLAAERASGREYGDGLADLAARLLQVTTIPEQLRVGAAALYMHEQALEDARIGRKRAFSFADTIATGGVFDDLFIVLHARWLSHAFMGDSERAQALRKRSEIITEDDVWRHKAHVFVEAEYYALIGDLEGLSRVVSVMSELGQMFPGWRPNLAYTRAAIHRLRGELGAAFVELDAGLREARAGEHCMWLHLAPARAEVLLLLDRADDAEHAARAILDCVEDLDLRRSCAVAALRVLGLALSVQRRHAEARDVIAQALAMACQREYGGLPLARLYQAQARMELAAGDPRSCVSILKDVWLLLESSQAPALLYDYRELREQSARQVADAAPEPSAPDHDGPTTQLDRPQKAALYQDLLTLLTSADGTSARAAQALQLLLQAAGAHAGHLLLRGAGGLYSAASIGLAAPSAALMKSARSYLEVQRDDANTVTQSSAWTDGEEMLVPIVLASTGVDGAVFAGMALIRAQAELHALKPELVQVISQSLLATGDAVAFDSVRSNDA